MVTKNFAVKFGIPYLFLDPEYLGRVNMYSFFIVGFAFGGFVITWNLTHYILNSFRFPFLATLKKPFLRYVINNSILPLIFLTTYFYHIIQFQLMVEFQSTLSIIVNLLSFLVGMIIVIVLSFLYFYNTNKNLIKMFGIKTSPDEGKDMGEELEEGNYTAKAWVVRFYMVHPFKARRVRRVQHYTENMIRSVFKQHHANAFYVQLGAIALLILFGLLMEKRWARIPTGASLFLLFSILTMFLGAFSAWMKGWRQLGFVAIFILVDILIQYNVLDSISEARGIYYNQEKVPYTKAKLTQLYASDQIEKDKKHTLSILQNWKHKNSVGTEKPKLTIITSSGGGQRAAVWTLNVLRRVDQELGYTLNDRTFMITGASAGLIGATYYRSLCYESRISNADYYRRNEYVQSMSHDMLNPITFAWVINDFLFPWQKHTEQGNAYSKDRGYMFEEILNENTYGFLNKPISYFKEAEANAEIPMVIVTPTIINNGQRLYISPQPISYLTKPLPLSTTQLVTEIDAVEFTKLFKNHNAMHLNMLAVMRMNASFPYVTPFISLPSEPIMSLMDAGARDNQGFETVARFLHVFRDWIDQNTSGVVILQIRDTEKAMEMKGKARLNLFDKVLNPIGNFYVNWSEFQDYNHDNLIAYAGTWLNVPVEAVLFEYSPSNKQQTASLSWHLTTREKKDLQQSIDSDKNKKALHKLRALLQR